MKYSIREINLGDISLWSVILIVCMDEMPRKRVLREKKRWRNMQSEGNLFMARTEEDDSRKPKKKDHWGGTETQGEKNILKKEINKLC